MPVSAPMSIQNLIKAVDDSDAAVVRNVSIMLRVRGLASHGIIDTDMTKLKWIIVGKPDTDDPLTATDHMRARLPTIVFRSEEHFNGRDAHRLLQRCWTEADALVQAEMICFTEFYRHVVVLTGPIPKRKRVSVVLPDDSPYAHTPRDGVSRMDVFEDISLRFNILNHILVPVHRPLRKEEITALGERYGKTGKHNDMESQGTKTPQIDDPVSEFIMRLPRICITDPVVRFIGGVAYTDAANMLSGTIYEITRDGYEIALRRVVDDLGR